MVNIHYYVFLLLAVLFHKTGLVKLVGYPKEETSGISRYQSPSAELEIERKQNSFHINGKTKRNQGGINQTLGSSDDLSTFVPLYRLRADESTCVLLTVDAILSLRYLTAQHEVQVHQTYVPNMPKVTGNCTDENEQNLSLSWRTYVLTWYFVKLPDKGRWFVSKIDLKYEPADLFFEFINSEGVSYTLSSSTGNNGDPIFAAPIGKSYKCNREIEVNLSSTQINTVASLFMRALIVKPFVDDDQFGQEYVCTVNGSTNSNRSELSTIGSLLAVVLTILIHIS